MFKVSVIDPSSNRYIRTISLHTKEAANAMKTRWTEYYPSNKIVIRKGA